MAIDWRVAGALDQLLDQLNALAPRRSKRSDGAIGDAAHASRSSDHNPWLIIGGQHYVSARDYTHDPAGGLNCQLLAESLQRGRDQRVKYVIWNRRIMAGAGGPQPWTWRSYSGSNPHTAHLHLSVVADLRATVRIPWTLPTFTGAEPAPPISGEDDDMTPEESRLLREVHQQLLAGWPGWGGGTGESLTAVDYLRRSNVEVQQVHVNLGGVHQKLEALRHIGEQLLAGVPLATSPTGDGPALTADDVRTLIREALADLGPLHLIATKETP